MKKYTIELDVTEIVTLLSICSTALSFERSILASIPSSDVTWDKIGQITKMKEKIKKAILSS